ncbi:MAG: hypothetical protein IJE23_01480 [Tyzzerella sp.]|nr:hypothetical protein [Tyzzerella sp.]
METKSRSEKAVKNVTMGLLSKAVVLVLGFIDRKFFITILGEELLGINGLFSNILLMLSLAEMGLTNVMVLSYYEPLEKHDYEKLSSLTAFYKKIYNTIAVVIALIGVILIPFLKYIVKLENPIENMVLIYLIFLANTVFSYLFIYKSTILTADQNGHIVTKTQMKFDLLRQVVQIIVLLVFNNIISYLVVKIMFVLFNNLYLMRCVDKTYPFLDLKHAEKLSKSERKNIASTIKSGFIYKISSVLLNGTDNIIISALIGTVWVGMIANYDTVITSITAFIVIIFTSLTSSLGNLNVSAEPKKKMEIFDVVLFAGFWIALIVVPCCCIMMDDLVALWLGEKYVLDDGILYAKLGMMYLSCTLNPIFSFREATGLFRKTKYMIFAGAIVNIILSLVLGKIMGVSGVLFASIMAMLVTYIWYEPVVLYREHFDSSPFIYFGKHLVNLIKLVSVVIIATILVDWLQANNWIMLFVKASFCFITVFALSFILMFKSREFVYIKRWGMRVLVKKNGKRGELS